VLRKYFLVHGMKQSHHCQAKAYHDYYLHSAGRGYPVYVGTRYQRGHGLGSIFGALFKAAVPLCFILDTNPFSFCSEVSPPRVLARMVFWLRCHPEYSRRRGSRQELETSGQIQIEINGTKLTPESTTRPRANGILTPVSSLISISTVWKRLSTRGLWSSSPPLKKKFDIGMNEIGHKIGIAVKKDCQVTISPLLQHMLGFKRAIFPHGDHVADWVADVTRGVWIVSLLHSK
jgi:hypothetical protein